MSLTFSTSFFFTNLSRTFYLPSLPTFLSSLFFVAFVLFTVTFAKRSSQHHDACKVLRLLLASYAICPRTTLCSIRHPDTHVDTAIHTSKHKHTETKSWNRTCPCRKNLEWSTLCRKSERSHEVCIVLCEDWSRLSAVVRLQQLSRLRRICYFTHCAGHSGTLRQTQTYG